MHVTNRPNRTAATLIAIGVFKLVKCVLLTGLGIALFYWRDQDLGHVAASWINTLWVGRPFVASLTQQLSALGFPARDELAAGSFIYAALLLVEGVGLCRGKRWAEYLTVAITASLLPFEFYAVFHHATAVRVVIMLLNIAILVYLVFQLRRHDEG